MTTRGGNWTWSFYKLSLRDGSTETLAGPDWVEKNFPRMTVDGHLVWSMHDEQDREVLAERGPKGKVSVLAAAGDGARWPSYSADGKWVLFTTINHQVEYWLAENPFGAGSPVTDNSTANTSETNPADAPEICQAGMGFVGIQRSPADKFRR
jgi:TolB protein